MSTTFQHGYALLIGVNENSISGWALPDVAKDVAALQAVLTHRERCGYSADHVCAVQGPDATRQKILDGLDWLQAQVAADTSGNATAVVYYSGHGWRDSQVEPPTYYLIPYDVRRDKLRTTALRAEDLAEAIEAVRPQRLLTMLDCCHAGGMDTKTITLATGHFEPAALPPGMFVDRAYPVGKALDAKDLDQLLTGAGRAVLTSSTSSQQSYIRADRTMSIFTYHLIEALTGHAQPQDGAAEVLVSDVLSYVYRRVPQSAKVQTGADQQPDGRIMGNFAVALLLGGKGLSRGEIPPDPLADLPIMPSASGTTTIYVSGSGASATAGGIVAGAGGIAIGGNVQGGIRLGSVDTRGGAYVDGNVTTGSDFVGRDKIVQGDEVRGNTIAGDKFQFHAPVTADALAVGRNAQITSNRGLDPAQLSQLLAPVLQAVGASRVGAEQRTQAEAMVHELQQELAKGHEADDSRLARLVDGFVALVPGAISAVTAAFASPILAGVAGPVTQFVLGRMLGKA